MKILYQGVNLRLAKLRANALFKACQFGDIAFVIILDFIADVVCQVLLIKISCVRIWDGRFHSAAARRKYTFF